MSETITDAIDETLDRRRPDQEKLLDIAHLIDTGAERGYPDLAATFRLVCKQNDARGRMVRQLKAALKQLRAQDVADEDLENAASCAQDTRIRELEQENDLLRARIQATCEHAFPNSGDGEVPGDCRSCGMTYQQYDARFGERMAEALEGGA